MRAQPTTIEPVQYFGRIPRSSLQEPSCKRGYFVHVGFGSHTQLRACGGACKWRLRPWAEPASTRMQRHVQVATSAMGGAFKDPACASIWAELANLMQLFWMALTSFISACVAALSTSSWTAELPTQAPSIWISARFVGVRCEHAVCTMTLSFIRYTIGGEEPRTPRPVP